MSLDELLFEEAVSSDQAYLRCYQWNRSAMTLGYFSPWEARDQTGRSVRRWTGGGRVEHGEDLTFALAIPGSEDLSKLQSPVRYTQIHTCLMNALSTIKIPTRLESGQPSEQRTPDGPAPCFISPVASDLMNFDGEKIAGGAQRRARGAILHQGSVRLPLLQRKPDADWITHLRKELSSENQHISDGIVSKLLSQITKKQAIRYDLPEWNRRRE